MKKRRGTKSTIGRHECDIERKTLLRLHEIDGLSWRKIANLDRYNGIPAGTLCSFANGDKELPDQYKWQLGIPFTAPASVCPIHGVVHEYDCQSQRVSRKPAPKIRTTWTSLFDLPEKELLQMLKRREEF